METNDGERRAALHERIDQLPPACDEPRAVAAPRDNFPGKRTTLRFNTERVSWSDEW